MKKYVSHSEAETLACGAALAGRLRPGDLVALFGDLGSGKTCIIKGICEGLGIREHVASPSFTLVNEYHHDALAVYHFDFYRLDKLQEVLDIGFEEYLGGEGICLVEWAEKASSLLPPRTIEVRMSCGEDECIRHIVIREPAGVPA